LLEDRSRRHRRREFVSRGILSPSWSLGGNTPTLPTLVVPHSDCGWSQHDRRASGP
jgi:hypothetical protein